MINLTKSTANTVAVTLYEKTTIAADSVYYLFEFVNQQTQVKSYCIPTDTSDFISRYNLFTITDVASSPTPTDGEVSLDKGDHHYFVYEQESPTNLDPDGLTLVESGIARVFEAPASDTIYQTTNPQYTVYSGGK